MYPKSALLFEIVNIKKTLYTFLIVHHALFKPFLVDIFGLLLVLLKQRIEKPYNFDLNGQDGVIIASNALDINNCE